MLIRLHGNATATPAKRAYIYRNRHRPTAELQRELGLGYRTVVRWKERPDGQDGAKRKGGIGFDPLRQPHLKRLPLNPLLGRIEFRADYSMIVIPYPPNQVAPSFPGCSCRVGDR